MAPEAGTSAQPPAGAPQSPRVNARPSFWRKWRVRTMDKLRYYGHFVVPVAVVAGAVYATVAFHHYMVRRKYGPDQPVTWLDYVRMQRSGALAHSDMQQLHESYMREVAPQPTTVRALVRESVDDVLNLRRPTVHEDMVTLVPKEHSKVFQFLEGHTDFGKNDSAEKPTVADK